LKSEFNWTENKNF